MRTSSCGKIKWKDFSCFKAWPMLSGDGASSKTRLQFILIISNWWAHPSKGNLKGGGGLMQKAEHPSTPGSTLAVFSPHFSHLRLFFCLLLLCRAACSAAKTVSVIWNLTAHDFLTIRRNNPLRSSYESMWLMPTVQTLCVIKYRFVRLISILIKTLTPLCAIKDPRRLFSSYEEWDGWMCEMDKSERMRKWPESENVLIHCSRAWLKIQALAAFSDNYC